MTKPANTLIKPADGSINFADAPTTVAEVQPTIADAPASFARTLTSIANTPTIVANPSERVAHASKQVGIDENLLAFNLKKMDAIMHAPPLKKSSSRFESYPSATISSLPPVTFQVIHHINGTIKPSMKIAGLEEIFSENQHLSQKL